MDVCIVTTIHAPLDTRIYQRELMSLIDSGLSVCLVAPWPQPEDLPVNVTWVSLKPPMTRWQRVNHVLRTWLVATRVSCRAYLFHDLDFLPFAVLLRRFKRVPVVYDCHENYPEEVAFGKEWIPRFLRGAAAHAVRMLEDWAVQRLDAVLTVVPYQESRFSRLGARTVMVRNFSSWGARPDVPHARAMIYSGSISKNYGADILLSIARELKKRSDQVTLVLTDRFADEAGLREHFLETIRKEQLPVRIEPQVSSVQLDTLLAKGSIGLLVSEDSPNKHHAYHTKMFEYMAMGMPVVAADLELTREVINTAQCGVVVPPNDAQAYVEVALSILGDSRWYSTYRLNGLWAAEHLYHWKHEAERLVELFRSLLSSGANAQNGDEAASSPEASESALPHGPAGRTRDAERLALGSSKGRETSSRAR